MHYGRANIFYIKTMIEKTHNFVDIDIKKRNLSSDAR